MESARCTSQSILYNSRWRWELTTDLYWEFRYWANYDSDPPAEGALNTDFGITTSLGYSW